MKKLQKYKVLASAEVSGKTNGTCFQGDFRAHYTDLIKLFGKPTFEDTSDGKVQAEWVLQFKDGRMATIYDWKQYDTEIIHVRDWHIGGHNKIIVPRVKQITDELEEPPLTNYKGLIDDLVRGLTENNAPRAAQNY